MPIVRLDDKGKLNNGRARSVAAISGGVVIAGVILFFVSPAWGIFTMLLGNSLASIWNLADDS